MNFVLFLNIFLKKTTLKLNKFEKKKQKKIAVKAYTVIELSPL